MDSLLALLLVFGVFAGIALGFVIGKSVTRSSTKAELIALQASVDAERATVIRLEAERARRVEEEKEELSIVTAMRDLKTKMGDLEKLTHDAEVKRVAGETSIKEQIEAMRTGNESLLRQTTKLTGALANPATRGKYGETQLEMLLKNAGLLKASTMSARKSARAMMASESQISESKRQVRMNSSSTQNSRSIVSGRRLTKRMRQNVKR
jgi:DNA recombination protein RmuC